MGPAAEFARSISGQLFPIGSPHGLGDARDQHLVHGLGFLARALRGSVDEVVISFKEGVPVAIDGIASGATEPVSS